MFLISSILSFVETIIINKERNESIENSPINKPKRIIAFDLDNTIGDFSLISSIYENCIIDNVNPFYIFSRCFRPGIFKIFELLQLFKDEKIIDKVIIYTNNTGGKKWVGQIVNYIHKYIKSNLFDDIISAYSVNDGEEYDNRRSSMEKTIDEVSSILNLKQDDHLMFIDDMIHSKMINTNVYYIHVNTYYMYYNESEWIDIIENQCKLSENTRAVIMDRINSYPSYYVNMGIECEKMIEFTKLLANFVIRNTIGFTKL